jgi:hypothetical protein
LRENIESVEWKQRPAMIIKDHKDNLNRELSLVEQKKMQWAKERGECATQFSMFYMKIGLICMLIVETPLRLAESSHSGKFPPFFSSRRDGEVGAIPLKVVVKVRAKYDQVKFDGICLMF